MTNRGRQEQEPVDNDHHMGILAKEEMQETVTKIHNTWGEIVRNPEDTIINFGETNFFAAGGGLPALFGLEKDETWEIIEKAIDANSGRMVVADIDFSKEQVLLLGRFYRFLKRKGLFGHCIDERLQETKVDGKLAHVATELHTGCGACAGVHGHICQRRVMDQGRYTDFTDRVARSLDTLNQTIAKELSEKDPDRAQAYESTLEARGTQDKAEQEIRSEMKEHRSLVILVDLHGCDAVSPEKRDELAAIGALPFNVSLPVEYIDEFIKKEMLGSEQADQLLTALVQWNVGIARNIIGGHNELSQQAQEALVVIDERDVSKNDTAARIQELISGLVAEHKTLKISD